MTSNTVLFIIVLALISYTAYSIIVNRVSPEERDEMLNDKEMWP
jgi:Tfp pilus assembly protein PilE